MKRVLFILHVPPPVHGAAVVGKEIKDSRAVNEAFECRYINLSTSETVDEVGRIRFSKIRAFKLLRKQVREALSDFRPDLVYMTPSASGPGFMKDYLIRRILRRKGMNVVVHFHNKGISTHRKWYHRALYRRFFKGLKVILLSWRLYPDLAGYVKKEDVLICPNGIPADGVGTESIRKGIPHVLFLSNLIPSKGVYEFLDACKILKERGKQFMVDIAGAETCEIPSGLLITEINNRDLEEQTVYHGRIYGGDKHSLFAMSDIFVFPTYYPGETFGLVILEAMLHSVPVISTSEGAIQDLVQDGKTGLVVPARDVNALADAIGKLLDDSSLRQTMGEAGRSWMLSSFTLEHFENQFIKCIKTCLEPNTFSQLSS